MKNYILERPMLFYILMCMIYILKSRLDNRKSILTGPYITVYHIESLLAFLKGLDRAVVQSTHTHLKFINFAIASRPPSLIVETGVPALCFLYFNCALCLPHFCRS